MTPEQATAMRDFAVVIPCYRAGAWLSQAVSSALAQTLLPSEVVVVDDATPPEDAGALDTLPAEVRVIRLARNGGVGAARNLGVRASRAPLIAFLDADDWWEATHLEAALATLDRHPDSVATYATTIKRRADGSSVPCLDKPSMLGLREAMVRSHLLPSGLVMRREALMDLGGWSDDPRMVEDWDLTVRLIARFGPIPLVAAPPVNYRVGHGASVNSRHAEMLRKWRHTLRTRGEVLDREFGAGSARRRMAQALLDRADRAGGWRGWWYRLRSRWFGRPLREAWPS